MKSPEYRQFLMAFAREFEAQGLCRFRPDPLQGYEFVLTIHKPTYTKGKRCKSAFSPWDISNRIKPAEDAWCGCAGYDDNQHLRTTADKVHTDGPEYCEITLLTHEPVRD